MNRDLRIDVLRGLSIFLVMFSHSGHLEIDYAFIPRVIYQALFGSGYYGVTIFFVISGFLITRNTLKRYGTLPNISIVQFYVMRASRILPLLILLLAFLSVLNFTKYRTLPFRPI